MPARTCPRVLLRALLAAGWFFVSAAIAAAQTASPALPPTFTRDAQGRGTVTAIALAAPLRLDGVLDEPVYASAPPITDFFQTYPAENGAPTERTEAWVLFDAAHVYVSARLWDSAPPSKWTANEMRRDTNQLRQNDHFGVAFDTFHDRRNGYFFYANPLGARADSYMTDESNNNADWNPVWDVRTARFDGGWTIEMRIPFKSLRYVSGSSQVWGINMRRAIRRRNEWDYLSPLPLSIGGSVGMMRVSADAVLTGLDLPPASRNLEIKPYVVGRATTDRTVTPAVSNELGRDLGVDAKYGITANLTADVTVNTDFAQVEIDEQQVNLTRFSLLFPEKRDFFLEGRGIFDFGRGTTQVAADTPQLFYSRRIGLNRGRVIPIRGGGRLTGKVGGVTIGALNIQAGDDAAGAGVPATPDTNFTALRVKRDILRRSTIGAIFTNRSVNAAGTGANQAYGADAALSFFDNVTAGGYYARTVTPGVGSDDDSYQGRFYYDADRYGARVDYMKVGKDFNPEVGFLRRLDFKRSAVDLRFSPRPTRRGRVRQYTWDANAEYIENNAGHLDSRSATGHFGVELTNSDQISVDANANYEGLVRPFTVATGVAIAPGGYAFNDVIVRYQGGQQRRISGSVTAQAGQFYDGTIQAFTVSSARVSLTPQWSLEPSVSINRVALPAGRFTAQVLRARSDFAFTPRMFVSGLAQYSSSDRAFSSNLRFRWEYRPGSELFVVYTDERDTSQPWASSLRNKALVVKVNRLWQF
ncbi:MAG: DUF5916 domain-containing protein [Vicinamibacterales bacterium]